MPKTLFLTASLILAFTFSGAQLKYSDSLQKELAIAKEDTSKALLLGLLSKYYSLTQLDSCFYYAKRAVQLSQKSNYKYGEALGFFYLASALDREGNYPKALEMAYRCLRIAEQLKTNKKYVMSLAYYEIGLLNRLMDDDRNAVNNLRRAIQLGEQSEINNELTYNFYAQLGTAYEKMNQLDSALFFAQKGYNLATKNKVAPPGVFNALGNIFEKLTNYQQAEENYRLAIQTGKRNNFLFSLASSEYYLARFFKKTGDLDSCIYYARDALTLCLSHGYQLNAMRASSLLTQTYESQNNTDSTLKYMKIMVAIKDSVFSQAKMQQFQLIAFDEQQRQQQLKATEERYQNKIKLYALMTALAIFLLLAFILYRNNKQKQKANGLLQQQKEKVEQTLNELNATQAQLVQREKMASLGELTAGIAHEIQNPLNFVNNFSDVNQELLVALKEEADKGNIDEVKAIAHDVIENEQKINRHGKRADAIVKGMLQHSRSSSGKKEPTDINVLADEYLRLGYHGLKAKDKDFKADFKTDFDESIGKIEMVPQDIGRVLLNLYNNAFYAVNEKKKKLNGTFEPTVEVSTKRIGDKVEIVVRDNGSGIPPQVIDKIFQPFFTTKPTGQGTGLGLSLSYDIIKTHGGEIKVETKEGEGTEFFIKLPIIPI